MPTLLWRGKENEAEGVVLAVAGHWCRRGDCGMRLLLALTLSARLRPGHTALGGKTDRQTHTCARTCTSGSNTRAFIILPQLHTHAHTYRSALNSETHTLN